MLQGLPMCSRVTLATIRCTWFRYHISVMGSSCHLSCRKRDGGSRAALSALPASSCLLILRRHQPARGNRPPAVTYWTQRASSMAACTFTAVAKPAFAARPARRSSLRVQVRGCTMCVSYMSGYGLRRHEASRAVGWSQQRGGRGETLHEHFRSYARVWGCQEGGCEEKPWRG